MPVGAIGGAISGVGSLVGGLMGSSAASKAAQQIKQGYTQASGAEQQNNQQAIQQQQAATQQITGELSPYNTTGQQATNSLAGLLAPGGSLTQGYGSFSAPTAAQAAQTPGYQFQLQQGLNALQNSAAASGGLLSTGTAKNLENYAQGVASTNYQNTYGNALNAYNANANTFYNNQNNLFNRLSTTAGQGIGAASNLGSLQQSGANSLNGIYTMQGQELGQNDIGAAQALASGTVGSSNALVGGIQGGLGSLSGGLGGIMGQNSLGSLLGAQNAGGNGSGGIYGDA